MTVRLAPVSILNLNLWFPIFKSEYHGSVPASTVPRDKDVSLLPLLTSDTCTGWANCTLYCNVLFYCMCGMSSLRLGATIFNDLMIFHIRNMSAIPVVLLTLLMRILFDLGSWVCICFLFFIVIVSMSFLVSPLMSVFTDCHDALSSHPTSFPQID